MFRDSCYGELWPLIELKLKEDDENFIFYSSKGYSWHQLFALIHGSILPHHSKTCLHFSQDVNHFHQCSPLSTRSSFIRRSKAINSRYHAIWDQLQDTTSATSGHARGVVDIKREDRKFVIYSDCLLALLRYHHLEARY